MNNKSPSVSEKPKDLKILCEFFRMDIDNIAFVRETNTLERERTSDLICQMVESGKGIPKYLDRRMSEIIKAERDLFNMEKDRTRNFIKDIFALVEND